jgi:glycosyltransferase involved in cell wall biosynthesis
MGERLLTIVIPAFNEASRIGETVQTAIQSLLEAGIDSSEVIVSDDASSDETADLAREAGATVVVSGKRNIGAARNRGAAVATGKYLLFLDADTRVHASALRLALEALQAGAAGGGALVTWSEPASLWLRGASRLWNLYSRLTKSPAGSFFFVTREAFEAVGGFDEEYYVSEEIYLGRKLKKIGKLVIIPEFIATSPRKAVEFTLGEHLRLLFRMLRSPRSFHRSSEGLEIWYTRRGR